MKLRNRSWRKMKFLYICIFFFRVTEINRFLLDHEYPNISEASKVIRHVPNYDFEKLSPHMQVIWPIICQKNQLIIESNPWLATPIQNLEYKKYIIVNFFWRSTHSYCKHGNPENERNFKVLTKNFDFLLIFFIFKVKEMEFQKNSLL